MVLELLKWCGRHGAVKHPLDVSVLLVGVLAVAGTALVVAWRGERALAHCCWALSRFGTQEHIRRERVIDILASARHLRGLRSPFEVSAPKGRGSRPSWCCVSCSRPPKAPQIRSPTG